MARRASRTSIGLSLRPLQSGIAIFKGRGFTIVELLIVVVVIAILATITIVSYNGITKRAQQASILAQVDHFEKSIRMYKETYGEWPLMPTSVGQHNWACLGTGYINTATMPANSCWTDNDGNAMVSTSSTLNNALLEFVQGDSKIDTHEIATSGSSRFRGIVYDATNSASPTLGKYVNIWYAPDGDNTCGRGTAGMLSGGGNTYNLCSLTLK
jgi:prepilin-type N-terminal cleavage/methylation domain-containing protein